MSTIPKIQDADLRGKIVLVRVDHNVAKKHVVQDPFRIDVTFGTLFNILSKGGKLILMTHVGRPRDKKTGRIDMDSRYAVQPIVDYLGKKLHTKFHVPDFQENKEQGGYVNIDSAINLLIRRLRRGTIDGIYLPNVRWFRGEEGGGREADEFGKQLAGLADVFVNDAFGSWQPHTSTVEVARHLPSYAGYLMQHEIQGLQQIYEPRRPFLAVIAGSKFDTKIGPLRSLLETVDNLMLGGVIYNAYLCVKHDIQIQGIDPEDIEIAREFYKVSERYPGKVLEPSFVVESDTPKGQLDGQHRVHDIRELEKGTKLNYVVDIDPQSYDDPVLREKILNAESIFVNAVMGFTPHFTAGTKELYTLIDQNRDANKMFGGGDTLQEFRTMLPGTYIRAVDAKDYYFFSGGGTILKAIHEGSVTGLATVKALVANGGREM
ncbi:MAG: phosphoglycerate kinase [Planctomycetota bacterium]